MTPLIGSRAQRKVDSDGFRVEVPSAAAAANAAAPSRAADYAYRIVAVTTGLVLLATVM
jgi:hypothetical protein